MSTTGKTLHWAVDKWLAPTPAMPARVVRFCRTQMHRRCVCVEAVHPSGLLSIFFSVTTTDHGMYFRPPKHGRRCLRGGLRDEKRQPGVQRPRQAYRTACAVRRASYPPGWQKRRPGTCDITASAI